MLIMRCHVLKFVESSGFPIVGAVMGGTTPPPPDPTIIFENTPIKTDAPHGAYPQLKHEAPSPSEQQTLAPH